MTEGEVQMWNGQAWSLAEPQRPMTDWDLLVSSVLALLGRRDITPDQAMSWLWMLVELEEARSH